MFGFFKKKPKPAAQPPAPSKKSNAPRLVVGMSTETHITGEVQVAGTTTFAREAVESLAQRHGMAPRDMIELPATIQRDPDNPVNPKAVVVLVEGEKVGALPQFVSHNLELPEGSAETVRYQLHALRENGKKMKAKAFVWLGNKAPAWTYTAAHPAPLLTQEQAREKQEHSHKIAADNLAPNTKLGRALRSGNMRGYTPIELVEPIKQLKREKRWEEALTMLYACIEAEENALPYSDSPTPAPWYTEHAAICHRKLKQHDEEVAVLRRYLEHLPPHLREGSRIHERLSKIKGAA